MAVSAHPRIVPMTTAGTQHFIERTYREGGTLQWVRETYLNAEEAGATRIEFGVEWQAVENLGVYRRTIADNGRAMDAEELVAFFNTFGGGGKPIGGLHENFGVGAKTSLLPWNKRGVVVVSWVDSEPSMIWVQQDPDSGEYGLRLMEVTDEETNDVTLETVYAPFNDEENGCNWEAIRPEWIKDNGTVIVLLGNSPTDDTVLGDPNRPEGDIKGLSSYLNRRLWVIPDGMKVTVDELRTQDRAGWPPNERVAHGTQVAGSVDKRTNLRTVQGAHYFIDHPGSSIRSGKLAHEGSVALEDGTAIDWYLWEGDRPAVQSYAAISGYIGALYKNELYDVTSHQATFRSFGITESQVRQRVWLLIRPPLAGDAAWGVYPRTDRNALLVRGGPNPGGPLPMNEWGAQFAEQMPEPILKAIQSARRGYEATIDDASWRERLKERFGARWRMTRLRVWKGGSKTVLPTQKGTEAAIHRPTKSKRRRNSPIGPHPRVPGGLSGVLTIGHAAGHEAARETRVGGALPIWRAVSAADVEAGMLAAWQPNDPEHPEGVVLLNVEHPVLADIVEHWQAQFPEMYAEDIRKEITSIYGEVAVAKIAHSEYLRGLIPTDVIEKDLRSPKALTMSLLGLMAEEAVIAPRLGGKYRKKKAEVV